MLPSVIIAERHGHSEFNDFQDRLKESPLYQQFLGLYEKDPSGPETVHLAEILRESLTFGKPEEKIGLSNKGRAQARIAGKVLRDLPFPDIVISSPHSRCLETHSQNCITFPKLVEVQVIEESLLCEQSHGKVNEYCDWKVFLTLHPDEIQKKLQRGHDYAYPGGESVRELLHRMKRFNTQVLPRYKDKIVQLDSSRFPVTVERCLFQDGDLRDFDRINEEEGLVNCGIAVWVRSADGQRMELKGWNLTAHT
jgi:broad specificity phosphatase PhoE